MRHSTINILELMGPWFSSKPHVRVFILGRDNDLDPKCSISKQHFLKNVFIARLTSDSAQNVFQFISNSCPLILAKVLNDN